MGLTLKLACDVYGGHQRARRYRVLVIAIDDVDKLGGKLSNHYW